MTITESTTPIGLTRACKTCGIEKPMTEFQIGKRHYFVCRKCRDKHYLELKHEIARRYYQKNKATIKAKVMEYHHEHWDEYYATHSDARKQRTKEYYQEVKKPRNLALYGKVNDPRQDQQTRERLTRNKVAYGTVYTPDQRERRLAYYAALRKETIENYGGKCECCSESTFEVLAFRHKISNGYQTGIDGMRLLYAAIAEFEKCGYPNEKYRVLCWNCILSQAFYHHCPHNKPDLEYNYPGKDTKLEMINAYGGKCELCSETRWQFLTTDHIFGGGTAHRRLIGQGKVFYLFLKRNGWPKDKYRLLCANHNCGAHVNQWGPGGLH